MCISYGINDVRDEIVIEEFEKMVLESSIEDGDILHGGTKC